MYLRTQKVSSILADFAALSAPGSRIALTYMRRKNGRVPRSLFLAILGGARALLLLSCPEEMTDLARKHSWRLLSNTTIEDWLKDTPALKLTSRQVGLQWLESIWVGETA